MTRSLDIYNRLKKEGKPVELCDTREGRRVQKKSGWFFATANVFDADARYMNGIHYVNLWHGVPIKKIGEDMMASIREKTFSKRLKTVFRRYCMPWEFIFNEAEKITCGSPFFKPFMQSAFLLSDERIILVPELRLERLKQKEKEALTKQLDEQYGNPLKVLYMPTFRDNNLDGFNPFAAANFNKDEFSEVLVSENIVFLYKSHFLDGSGVDVQTCERIKIINDDDYDDLYSLLKDIDVLVTDYSSVYFDYLYLHKPIVLFPFDYEEYIKTSRSFYFDYNLMRAKRVYTWTELADTLKNKTYYPPSDEEVSLFRPIQLGDCCGYLINQLMHTNKN